MCEEEDKEVCVMKKNKIDWVSFVIVVVIALVINYFIYQAIPDDSKWMFWLLGR